MLNGA